MGRMANPVDCTRFRGLEGDTSEDHLAHLACNVAFLIWAVKKGVISQEDFTRSM